MNPIEQSILIIAVIVALAVPWPGVPNPWQPSGYSLLRWALAVILLFMLCAMWILK